MARLILREDARRTPLDVSLPRLEALVSSYTGLVPFTGQILNSPDDPPLFHVAAVTANTEKLIGFPANKYSGGISPSREHALAASLGEAAERYAGACYPEDELVMGAAAELGPRAVDPASFALFSDAQYATPGFPYARFDAATRLRWVTAHDVLTGDERLVPAQLVYLVAVHDEPSISYGTSSGMACGPTFEEALLGGLLEVAERDAFLLMWYDRLSLPRIDWSGDALLVEEHRRFYAPTRLDYVVVSMYDLLKVPTALVIVRAPDGNVALAVGAASATTMQSAIRKALREAFQTRAFGRHLMLDRPTFDAGVDFANVHTFEDHVLHFAFERNVGQTWFMEASDVVLPLAAVPAIPEATVTEAVREMALRLHRAGANTFVSDITPADLRSAGLHVVRVVSPELCRLDVDYRHRFLGGRRLYDAAYEAGVIPAPLAPSDLNPQPHPFP
jgi:ribosomal protein S12 methylthiotransferase accessory factor